MQPCPFCGSDTRLNKFSKRIGKATPHIVMTAQVKCKRQTCGMSGPLFKGEGCNERAKDHWQACKFSTTLLKKSGPEKALT